MCVNNRNERFKNNNRKCCIIWYRYISFFWTLIIVSYVINIKGVSITADFGFVKTINLTACHHCTTMIVDIWHTIIILLLCRYYIFVFFFKILKRLHLKITDRVDWKRWGMIVVGFTALLYIYTMYYNIILCLLFIFEHTC